MFGEQTFAQLRTGLKLKGCMHTGHRGLNDDACPEDQTTKPQSRYSRDVPLVHWGGETKCVADGQSSDKRSLWLWDESWRKQPHPSHELNRLSSSVAKKKT